MKQELDDSAISSVWISVQMVGLETVSFTRYMQSLQRRRRWTRSKWRFFVKAYLNSLRKSRKALKHQPNTLLIALKDSLKDIEDLSSPKMKNEERSLVIDSRKKITKVTNVHLLLENCTDKLIGYCNVSAISDDQGQLSMSFIASWIIWMIPLKISVWKLLQRRCCCMNYRIRSVSLMIFSASLSLVSKFPIIFRYVFCTATLVLSGMFITIARAKFRVLVGGLCRSFVDSV